MSDLYSFLLAQDSVDIDQKNNEYDQKQNDFQRKFNDLFTETSALISRSKQPVVMPQMAASQPIQLDYNQDFRTEPPQMLPSMMYTLDRPLQRADLNKSQQSVDRRSRSLSSNNSRNKSEKYKIQKSNQSNYPGMMKQINDDDSDAEFQYNKQKNQYSDFYSALKEKNDDFFDMPDELELEKLSTAVEEESRKQELASETSYMKKLRLKRSKSQIRRQLLDSNNGSPDSRYNRSNTRRDNADMPAAGQKRNATVKFEMQSPTPIKLFNQTPLREYPNTVKFQVQDTILESYPTPQKQQFTPSQQYTPSQQPTPQPNESPYSNHRTIKKMAYDRVEDDRQSFNRIFNRENSSYLKFRDRRNQSEETLGDRNEFSRANRDPRFVNY